MDAEAYEKLYRKRTDNSPLFKNCVFSFLVGGAICTTGEGLLFLYRDVAGMDRTAAGMLVSVTLIFLSAILTGVGLYDRLAKIGGAGTLVPITGFANAMISPALEYRTEGLVLGTGVKLFSVAGPVIAYGTAASVIYGAVYYAVTVIFK